MYGMFATSRDYTFLKKLDLSKWNTANVTNMSSMFRRCRNLEELILGENFTIQASTSTNDITSLAHANTVAAIEAKLPVTE